MRLSISLLVFFALAGCISAGRGFGRCGAGAQVKRNFARKPVKKSTSLFYNTREETTDVTIYVQADHSATLFLNGVVLDKKDSCKETITVGAKVKKGDVIGVKGSAGSDSHSFYMTVTSANGDVVHMTTGQDGWTAVQESQAAADWNQPGFDDSSWPAAVPSGFQCYSSSNLNPIFKESGAVSIWADGADYTQIVARYVVGGRGPDCSCNAGSGCSADGICQNCLLIEDDGNRDCYTGWNESQCHGDTGEYVWCG